MVLEGQPQTRVLVVAVVVLAPVVQVAQPHLKLLQKCLIWTLAQYIHLQLRNQLVLTRIRAI